MLREYHEVAIDAERVHCQADGTETNARMDFEFNQEGAAQHAAYPIRIGAVMGRADVAAILINQCERLGIPISWNIPIVDYEEAADGSYGIAIAADGRQFKADVVVAADGIGSKSHRLTLGQTVRAESTGYVAYRSAVSTAGLHDAPLLRKVLRENERPQCRIYAGEKTHTIFVVSKRLISCATTLPEVCSPSNQAVHGIWLTILLAEGIKCIGSLVFFPHHG